MTGTELPSAPTGRIAVIADAHLGGPGGEAGPLIDQLRGVAARGGERLLLLGDLFQAWVGNPSFETPEVEAVTPVLRELKEAGLRIDYVEGNRDFFLAGSVYAGAVSSVVRELSFEAGGVRYLVVHGDGLDARDWKYRFWRRLSKSALSRFLVFQVPPVVARRLVVRTERRLSRTNAKHRGRIPEEVICAYGEKRLAEGYDCLLLGHFHEERRWRVAGGEIRLLPAWYSSRRVEWLP